METQIVDAIRNPWGKGWLAIVETVDREGFVQRYTEGRFIFAIRKAALTN